MHFINFTIFIVIICPSIISIHALESCNLFETCSKYCCKLSGYTNYCCSDCSKSINYHPDCYYSTISIPSIIGGVISSIIFIIVVSIIISICCGCICSSRTGIQRRGIILSAQQPTVTVMNSNAIPQNQVSYPPCAAWYPPGQAPYPQGQGPYPQGQAPYPQGQASYPQGQLPYPPAYPEIKSYQQGPVSPYPANQNPPPYNLGFVPDRP